MILAVAGAGCGSSAVEGAPRLERSDAGTTQARASLLRLEDLPQGWKKRAGGSGNSRDLVGFRCDGFKPDLSALTVKGIEGGSFWVPGERQLSNLTIVFGTEADATTAFNQDFAKLFDRCVLKVVGKKTSSGKIVHARRLSLQLGARNFAYTSTLEIDVSGKKHPAYAENVFLQLGRSSSVVLFTSLDVPFEPALERRLLRLVVDRLRS